MKARLLPVAIAVVALGALAFGTARFSVACGTGGGATYGHGHGTYYEPSDAPAPVMQGHGMTGAGHHGGPGSGQDPTDHASSHHVEGVMGAADEGRIDSAEGSSE